MTRYMLKLRLAVSYSRIYQQITVCGLYAGRRYNKVDDGLCSTVWEFAYFIAGIPLLFRTGKQTTENKEAYMGAKDENIKFLFAYLILKNH